MTDIRLHWSNNTFRTTITNTHNIKEHLELVKITLLMSSRCSFFYNAAKKIKIFLDKIQYSLTGSLV